MATSDLLNSVDEQSSKISPAEGWNYFIDSICERESRIDAGIDGATVRRLLERLATIARTRRSSTGPLYKEDLTQSFRDVCGYEADEGAFQLLQRMPGLGIHDSADGSRHFVDQDLADSAQSGDLVRYLAAQGESSALETLRGVTVPQRSLGVEISALLAETSRITAGQAFAAAKKLQGRNASDAFAYDAFRISMLLHDNGDSGGTSVTHSMEFHDLVIGDLSLSNSHGSLDGVVFHECIFDCLDLTEYGGHLGLPTFRQCGFETVVGVGSEGALTEGHFIDCVFEKFDTSSQTTQGILSTSGLSKRQKILLTVLKKVYIQSGAGRRESALSRGLNRRDQPLVAETISDLIAADLIIKGRAGNQTMYYSVRGCKARVRRMLEAGGLSRDDVLIAAR